MKTWLLPNRRALLFTALPWLGILGFGSLLLWSGSGRFMGTMAGWILAGAGLLGLMATVLNARQPRVAYDQGELLLFLKGRSPIRLPVDIVECFFLGQGPSGVRQTTDGDELEARNIVVRLAERAAEWHHGEVERRFGHWCDGYITINGAWCEAITPDVIGAMNHDLAEVKRARRRTPEPVD